MEGTLLRPALEWAVVVARRDASDNPAKPFPAGLRPYVQFQKLPAAAMRAARSAIEDEGEFRARVAEAAGEDEVGTAGWLWLTRPVGWEIAFDGEVHAEMARAEVAGEAAAEQSAERRLAGAEEAARRLEQRATEAESALVRARVEREALVAERDDLSAQLAGALDSVERLTEQRARAVRELKDTEARLARRDAELREARAGGGSAGTASTAPTPDPVTVSSEPDVDVAAVTDALSEARSALAATAAALERLTDLVPEVSSTGVAKASGAPSTPTPAPAAGSRRAAIRLGRGLHEESEEGARWLLGIDGVMVLVDGYNVTMSAWPDLTVTDQRRALDRALAGLHARTGAGFVVIYDGDGSVVAARPRERGVDVRFTDAGIEADDEIIELAAQLPADIPVVVVSDDRRVRDGVQVSGANLVGSRQFRALLTA